MLVLTTKNGAVTVPSEWTHRWSFLHDIHTDLGVSSVDWTYTDSLDEWVYLNQLMDDPPGKRMPLSTVWKTVQFMNPTDGRYLCYTEFDVPDDLRHTMYTELGTYIRSSAHCLFARCTRSLYNNFTLCYDPAYGVEVYDERIPLSRMNPDVQDLVRSLPLDTITGILYQARMKAIELGIYDEQEEVPWSCVEWHDVVKWCPYDTQRFTRCPSDVGIRIQDIVGVDMRGPLASHLAEARQAAIEDVRRLLKRNKVNAMPYLFAKLPLPVSHVPLRGHVQLDISSEGVPTLHAHNPLALWQLCCDHYVSCMLTDNRVPPWFVPLVSTDREALEDLEPREVFSLYTALRHSVCALMYGSITTRFVDSTEYDEVCRRFKRVLGRGVLHGLYTIALNSVALLHNGEKKRVVAFANAAKQVLDEAE